MCKLKVILKENGSIIRTREQEFHNLDLNVFAVPYFVTYDKDITNGEIKFSFEFLESKADSKETYTTPDKMCQIVYGTKLKRIYSVKICSLEWTANKWDSLRNIFKENNKDHDKIKFLNIAKEIYLHELNPKT
jgi:hypothetical protein